MRILLSGGYKTQNIVDGIEKNFSSSGDDFLVIEFLDDIQDLFSRGDYFDKVLITEQSITREYTITDDLEIRRRISDFAILMSKKPKRYNYVFLTQKEELANMIHEEILPIMNDSVVVLKKPKYSVQFFVDLIVTDVKQLPADIVYEPELIIPEDIPEDTAEEDFSDMEDMIVNTGNTVVDFEKELISGLDDLDMNIKVSDELNITPTTEYQGSLQDGISQFIPEIENENDSFGADIGFDTGNSFGADMTFENNEINSIDTDYTPVEEVDNGFNFDEQIDLNPIEPIKQSGELPDYTQPQIEETYEQPQEPQMEEIYEQHQMEDYTPVEEVNTGFIPGFDTDNQTNENSLYENDYIQPSPSDEFSEDLYATPENQSFDKGFENEYKVNNGGMIFEEDLYNTDETVNESEIAASLYGQDPNGISDLDYKNNQNNEATLVQAEALIPTAPISQPVPVPVPVPVPKKKGLFAKIKGNNTVDTTNTANTEQQSKGKSKLNIAQIKNSIQPFAARGNTILVTGCGGCGTSTIAFNLANIVAQLGYKVLLVDMDTKGRTQSYISKLCYDSMEPESANLMAAVNSSNGLKTLPSIVKQGFHLLTMGLGTDTAPVNELLHKEKLARFSNTAKTDYNFVIYDIPFDSASGFLSELVYMADNLVLVTEASNWGITKTLINMCNIESDNVEKTMFSRVQLVFNKYRNLNKLLGRKVKTGVDITKVMDQTVLELTGEDTGYHFEDLHIAGIINDDPDFENGWFETVQYSDTKKGQEIFLELLEHIVLHK